MNLEKIKEEIKEEEGYRDSMYRDHLGFATIGYGHLVLPSDKFKEGVKYSNKELEKVFDYDFQIAYQDAVDLCKNLDVSYECVEIIIHMCFQLGKPKVMKFKKMWAALEQKDFVTAGFEMEDSLWCKKHTPARAMRLSEKMKKLT
jgi:lysozyme